MTECSTGKYYFTSNLSKFNPVGDIWVWISLTGNQNSIVFDLSKLILILFCKKASLFFKLFINSSTTVY